MSVISIRNVTHPSSHYVSDPQETSNAHVEEEEQEGTPEAVVFQVRHPGRKIEEEKGEGGSGGGDFARRFALPDDVKTIAFEISMNEGEVLSVTVKKLKPNKKFIKKLLGYLAKVVPACVLAGAQIAAEMAG